MFKFVKVKEYQDVDIAQPVRKTEKAAAYDMVAAQDIVVPSYWRMMERLSKVTSKGLMDLSTAADFYKSNSIKPTLIPTGYKAYMPEGFSLDLAIRSSSPLKYWLIKANSIGIIDGDYADNIDNEGHIYFQVINMGIMDLMIKKGDIIGQAKFVPCSYVEDDACVEKELRTGGFGSTTAFSVPTEWEPSSVDETAVAPAANKKTARKNAKKK